MQPPGHAGGQPGVRHRRLLAGVGQDEGAGAIRALGLPRTRSTTARAAPPAGPRRGRSARAAGRRRRSRRPVPRSPRSAAGAGVEPERLARLRRPCGARRSSSRVRDAVAASVTKAPARRQLSHASIVVTTPADRFAATQPGHLRRREVGVERESRRRPQALSAVAQIAGDAHRPAVLPADRGPVRTAAAPVPAQHRLALVGEPDGVHLGAGSRECLAPGGEHRGQQLLRVLLDGASGRAPGVTATLPAPAPASAATTSAFVDDVP